jgi:hypothetical protein
MGYMIKEDDYVKFLGDYYTEQTIVKRFRFLLKDINSFLVNLGIENKVRIDIKSLKMTILDYYTDIVRMRIFQNIEKPNVEKVYGYTAYWFLKRHPLHVKTDFLGCENINERFVISYLSSRMLCELSIAPNKCKGREYLSRFIALLFYNLKYRLYTQQSIELMISAFFCGYRFAGQ